MLDGDSYVCIFRLSQRDDCKALGDDRYVVLSWGEASARRAGFCVSAETGSLVRASTRAGVSLSPLYAVRVPLSEGVAWLGIFFQHAQPSVAFASACEAAFAAAQKPLVVSRPTALSGCLLRPRRRSHPLIGELNALLERVALHKPA